MSESKQQQFDLLYPLGDSMVQEYEQLVEEAAYYRTNFPEEEQIPYLQQRLNEEVDELLRIEGDDEEKVRLLWGLDIDPDRLRMLQSHMASELADCLYYLVAGAHHKGISLTELLDRSASFYTKTDTTERIGSAVAFDKIMKNKMDQTTTTDYKPDYMAMQMFHCFPYYDSTDQRESIGRNPVTIDGIRVIGDGYFALWHTLTYVSNFLSLNKETYGEAAVEALGVFSAVAQTRLNSSLSELIRLNTEKINRRTAEGTLQYGDDIERVRVPEEERPKYTAWENTVVLLVHAPNPNI